MPTAFMIAPIPTWLPQYASTTNWMLWWCVMMVSSHVVMSLNVHVCINYWFWSSLYLFIAPSDYYDCYSDTPSVYAYYNNGSRSETRYGQLCINNTYHTVCTSGLEEADVQLLCTDKGAQYGYLVQSQDIQDRFYPPISQTGVTNINCSGGYGYFDPYYCSYQVSYDHCSANGGPALITCIYIGKINHTHSTCTYILYDL